MGTGSKCEGCSLSKSGSGFVQTEIGNRYEQTKLLIIGDLNGEAEVRDSLPFRPYSQSGSMLADAMREMNVSRQEVAIATVIKCRPKGDWFVGAPYAYSATQHCITNYLSDTIAELQPRVILAMGEIAFKACVATIKGRQGTLDYIRGYAMPGAGVATGIPVIGTYHPSTIRRGAAELTPLLQRDLRRAFLIATGKLVEGVNFILDPIAHKGNYQTAPTITEAWEWYRAIDPTRSIYSDLETPRSKREDEDDRNSFADRDINLVQFTQHRGRGIALPYRDEFKDVVHAILATPNRKVGHNWFGFDLPVLAANSITVNGEQDDTMLQFHHYHADLPQNLQAVAQFCGFPMAWKHLSDSEQELYGCIDVDATCWADETMTALLKRDGLHESYERYVREFWPILRDMANRGVPISDERRLALKAVIVEEDIRATESIKQLVPDEVLAQKQKNGYKNPPILSCEDCDYKGRGDHICTLGGDDPDEDGQVSEIQNVAIPYSLLAEENGLVLREVELKEEEKCRCTKKTRAACPDCLGLGIIPSGTKEMRWAALTEFNPNSSHQVKRFMRHMKHPVPKHAKRTNAETGEAAETTEVKELQRLFDKTKHPIYPLLIQKRQLTKMDGTYVEGYKPGRDGRIHTTFTMKPATWQLSSREPNVQNSPARGKSPFQKKLVYGFNEMLVSTEGHTLVNFDFKSFHAQTTACEAGLPDYLRLAKIDIHSFNACHFIKHPERHGLLKWSDADLKAFFKGLRKDTRIWTNGCTFADIRDSKTKSAGLGIGFGMRAKKLFNLYREDFDSLKEAEAIWNLIMVELFPGLLQWQEGVRQKAQEDKCLLSRFGAMRRFYDVTRWSRKDQKFIGGDQGEAAVAFLPASNAFGMIRWVMLNMKEAGLMEKYQLINTTHDSLKFNCPDALVEECIPAVTAFMESPCPSMVYPGVTDALGLSVEADSATGKSVAEMH